MCNALWYKYSMEKKKKKLPQVWMRLFLGNQTAFSILKNRWKNRRKIFILNFSIKMKL